jgi:Zn-dependent metalloprotease
MKAPGTAYDDDVLGRDPQPAHMRDYVATSEDNGGVHINSGIPNKAFDLVATALGGHAWERAGRIWYLTVTGGTLAHRRLRGVRRRDRADRAAEYGEDSEEVAAVRTAWGAVGVTNGGEAD